MTVEQSVRERYSEGARERQEDLCCPVDYDRQLLALLPQEIIDKVTASMTGANAEVEIYPGTHHGFAFPKRPVYHRDAAERHWERLLALYRRNLS